MQQVSRGAGGATEGGRSEAPRVQILGRHSQRCASAEPGLQSESFLKFGASDTSLAPGAGLWIGRPPILVGPGESWFLLVVPTRLY